MSTRVPPRHETTWTKQQSTITAATPAPARCDVCRMRDGWRGHCLQTCRTCGVNVHDACYGLASNNIEKLLDFECWACQAVGQGIEGRHLLKVDRKKRKLPGFCETIVQETRPTECVLCSVKTGNHAMHQLYDAPTKVGRQIIMPETDKEPMRLAWVHTICAFLVASHTGTLGSVYACNEDGNYDEEEEIDDQDSDEEEEIRPTGKAAHHFVMCGLDAVSDSEERESNIWVQALETHRKELKCYICGRDDTNALRVPLQCCAGNNDEFEEFKEFHQHLEEPCVQAMHAGCVHYGQSFRHRHCWFYPGSLFYQEDDETHNDPVGQIFCTAHASELGPASCDPTGKPKAALSRQRVVKKGLLHRTSTLESHTGVRASKSKKGTKTARDEPQLSVPRKKKTNSKVPSNQTSSATQDTGVEKSIARASGGNINDRKNRWTEDGCYLPANPPTKRGDGTYARPSGRSPLNLEWDYKRGLYVPQIGQKTDQINPENGLDNVILRRMADDVAQAVKRSLDKEDGVNLVEGVNTCRKHWRESMGKTAFKEYWKHVQIVIQKEFPDIFSADQCEQTDDQEGEPDDRAMEDDDEVEDHEDFDDNDMMDLDDDEEVEEATKPTGKPGDDPWAYLWADGANRFEFQGWDTYEEIVLLPLSPDNPQSTSQDMSH